MALDPEAEEEGDGDPPSDDEPSGPPLADELEERVEEVRAGLVADADDIKDAFRSS